MKWEQLASDDSYQRLRIEVDWGELAADYDDMVSRHARVRLPGFRAGKTPRSVIEKRFQGEIIAALAHRAVQRFGLQAVREAGMAILGPAEAEEVDCIKGRPFGALLRVFPMPKIDLPDLGSLGTPTDGSDPRDHISLRLLELVKFELPQRLIAEELGREGCAAESGSAEWQAAGERMRLLLIIRQIARQEGISVDHVDLQQRIIEKAEEFGTTPKKLQAELEEGGGMERLREMLLAESTLEYLLEKNRQDNLERRQV